MQRADVIVVGAGVMGAATTWRLIERGRSVVLLEQFAVGHDRGSSHGQARVFRFSYDDPEYVRMAMTALPLWRELEGSADRRILTVTGGLDYGPPETLDRHAGALSACGARFELRRGNQVSAAHPVLVIPADEPVLYQPDAGVLHAERAVESMVGLAERGGAVLRQHTSAIEVRTVGDEVEIATAGETFRAARAVVTAGAWARPFLAAAGIDLPVVSTRETVAFFPLMSPAPPPVFVEWPDGPLYALPSPDGTLKTGWHSTGPEADPDIPGPATDGVIERMAAWVGERFPGAEPAPARVETCLYTNTADERFLLERHGPIVVGSACSGHAFKFAPLIGERLADLALEA
jgi:sarcosine oxidase